jgi:hypothetical protein
MHDCQYLDDLEIKLPVFKSPVQAGCSFAMLPACCRYLLKINKKNGELSLVRQKLLITGLPHILISRN